MSNSWTALPSVGAPSIRHGHTAVWTGSEMIIWGGAATSNFLNDGAVFNPPLNTWRQTASVGSFSTRRDHSTVWTGTEMIVFGGSTATVSSGMLGDGSSFNPSTAAWTALPALNAPMGRAGHTAVWTGSEMIIWVGFAVPASPALSNDGARFNPTSQTWTAMNISSPPPARYVHSAVWTGSEMIILGGSGSTFPFPDTWSYTLPKTLIMYQRP